MKKKIFQWVMDVVIATIMVVTIIMMAMAIASLAPKFFAIIGLVLLIALVAVLLNGYRIP